MQNTEKKVYIDNPFTGERDPAILLGTKENGNGIIKYPDSKNVIEVPLPFIFDEE